MLSKLHKMNVRKQAEYLTQLMLQGKYEEMIKARDIITNANHSSVNEIDDNSTTSQNQFSGIRRTIPTKTKKPVSNKLKNDFFIADQFQYQVSPNTDSHRPRNEFLGGSGSNM